MIKMVDGQKKIATGKSYMCKSCGYKWTLKSALKESLRCPYCDSKSIFQTDSSMGSMDRFMKEMEVEEEERITKRCIHCGMILRKIDNFCKSCGKKQPEK